MNKVIFPIIPQVCDIERMKQGGEHWQWSPETPLYLGVLPRHGARGSDVKVSLTLYICAWTVSNAIGLVVPL